MKITIFGAGYVGLVTGTSFAELGNDVILVDIDEKRVSDLNQGTIPIYEPGLEEMLKRNIEEKRISFTLDASKAVKNSEIIFIAVGTPDKGDGSTDLKYVLSVAKTIGENINGYKVVVDKSTVPLGTAEKVRQTIKENMAEKHEFDLISNPEFLREGMAMRDFMVPDRIVIGFDSEKSKNLMSELYRGISRPESPIIYTSIPSAELIKYTSNAMLALRISFMNQLAPLCELHESADIKEIALGIGYDKRIGSKFLQAGIGFGGSCFPKDVASLAYELKINNLDNNLIQAILDVNEKAKVAMIPKIQNVLGENLKGKNIAIWGLAFKQRTDDMREAPSIKIIEELQKLGAKITAYDPQSVENAKKIFTNVIYAPDPYTCVKGADAVILVTEWGVFRNLDMLRVKNLMNKPNLFDGRNIYDPKKKREIGFNYYSIGRN